MRRIAVVTGTRADYGLLKPVIDRLTEQPSTAPVVVVAAMHLNPAFGMTVRDIEADGVPIAARIPTGVPGAHTQSIGARMAGAIAGFTRTFEAEAPQLVVVMGDRYEMLAAALAAAASGIPLAHIHGGELSEGSLDDAMRHCITKLSHLHFVAAEEYAGRVRRMGEEPWRVETTGALAPSAITAGRRLDRDQLAEALGGVMLNRPLGVLTLHPTSLTPELAGREADAVTAATMDAFSDRGTVVVTLPNDDPGNEVTRRYMTRLGKHANFHVFENLGHKRYFSLLALANVMIGNSSSGILEAPSFGLPVVNVGDRQRGRIRADNVIDCTATREAVDVALRKALSPDFARRASETKSPFGDESAARRIAERLAHVPIDDRLRIKSFFDGPDFGRAEQGGRSRP